MKTINWYPGHMKKTRELMEAHLKLVDVVCEICDARIPMSSRSPVIDELTKGKPQILLLNKSDLADEAATKEWLEYFQCAFAINAMSGQGVQALLRRLERVAAEKAASGTAKAQTPLRLMIVGVPNVGKSSLINRFAKRKAAQVGDRPGVTRGKQWLTIENGMQVLDMPGILWPRFEDQQVGLRLAFCGSIKDEIMDIDELGHELIRLLMESHADKLADRYGLEKVEGCEALEVMEAIANVRGFLLPGKRIDYERTARAILDDFRSGKIGRITLELPPRT